MSNLSSEISKRRTIAIITHPNAGKTTITEKVLLFGNALQKAGTVKGKNLVSMPSPTGSKWRRSGDLGDNFGDAVPASRQLRDTPILMFMNKPDRDISDPLEVLGEVERALKILCARSPGLSAAGRSLMAYITSTAMKSF